MAMISCLLINASFILQTRRPTQQDDFTTTTLFFIGSTTKHTGTCVWCHSVILIWLIMWGWLICTVFRSPTDHSHIFCQTSVNIYCSDLVLLSAVIVNLPPPFSLLTDGSDPWPGGASGRAWRWHLYVLCGVCTCEWWLKNFLPTTKSLRAPQTTTTTLWPQTKKGMNRLEWKQIRIQGSGMDDMNRCSSCQWTTGGCHNLW